MSDLHRVHPAAGTAPASAGATAEEQQEGSGPSSENTTPDAAAPTSSPHTTKTPAEHSEEPTPDDEEDDARAAQPTSRTSPPADTIDGSGSQHDERRRANFKRKSLDELRCSLSDYADADPNEEDRWLTKNFSIRSPRDERRGSAVGLSSNVLGTGSTRAPLPRRVVEDGFELPTFDASHLALERVGAGSQALVFRVELHGGEPFAIKALREDLAADPLETKAFIREVHLLARLTHTHINNVVAVASRCQGAATTKSSSPSSSSPAARRGSSSSSGSPAAHHYSPCVMLEWCSSDLTRALRLKDVGASVHVRTQVVAEWPAYERVRLAMELASALRFLHSGTALPNCVICHRDIKPDNVGIADGHVKLLDFGLAVCLEHGDATSATTAHTGSTSSRNPRRRRAATFDLTAETGTRRYVRRVALSSLTRVVRAQMAPEVAKRERYGVPADVYSFAVTAHEVFLLCGKPFARLNVKQHRALVVAGGQRPPVPRTWHAEIRELLVAAWHADQHARPTAAAAYDVLARVYERRPGGPGTGRPVQTTTGPRSRVDPLDDRAHRRAALRAALCCRSASSTDVVQATRPAR